MEFYQQCQNRTEQTVAVINLHIPGLTLGGVTTAGLLSLCNNLDGLALTRDQKVSDLDTAANAENLAYLELKRMTVALPAAAEAALDESNAIEADLISLLDEAYGITPRTVEAAIQRAKKLVTPLTKINAYLAGLIPPRGAVTSGGKGLVDLTSAFTNMPSLELMTAQKRVEANDGRTDLRNSARALDRFNKRFYKKLKSEAMSNPALAAALSQIDTEGKNLPETLSIRSMLQGGPDLLHVLVGYEPGTGSDATALFLEWMVEGVDADFAHTETVDFSGNQIGPFAPGQKVVIRTRTENANGTRTSAKRRLTIQPV
jgi:hypothetical protein